MADFREQRACIKFCFKLGKTATECNEMLKTALGNKLWVVPKHFSGFPGLRQVTSTDDDERSGRPVSSSTPEMIERVRQIIREDRRRTIDEVSMLVGPDQWRNNTMLLHHDNAPAHAALLTRRFLTDNK